MQHGIEWEQKGTHEEHLDVYNFKKKERKKEVHELEQEKENLTVENEGLTSQIADARTDIKLLEEGVKAGYWNLFSFNPDLKAEGKNPFTLTSKEGDGSYQDFLLSLIHIYKDANERRTFIDAQGMITNTTCEEHGCLDKVIRD